MRRFACERQLRRCLKLVLVLRDAPARGTTIRGIYGYTSTRTLYRDLAVLQSTGWIVRGRPRPGWYSLRTPV